MNFVSQFLMLAVVMMPSLSRAAAAIFKPVADLNVEAGKGAGGEGPAWHPTLGVLSSGNGHIMQKPNPPFEPADDVKGGIYVLDPQTGELLDFLPVATDEVTNCAFGGEDLKTLYVTGGGVLDSIRTATRGRVVWPK